MKITVTLVDSANFTPICLWNSPEIVGRIKRVDDQDNVFGVEVEVEGYKLSAFAFSVYSVVLDLLINRTLITGDKKYNFFVSEEPLFSSKRTGRNIEMSFYDRDNRQIVKEQRVEDVDAAMTMASCHGLGLIARLSPDTLNGIWRTVYDDIESRNRQDFIAAE